MKLRMKELRSISALPGAPVLLTFLAGRDIDKPIDIDKLVTGTKRKVPRADVVQFCKQLDTLGMGNFVAGRRTFPSRFVFYFTPASIGAVALNESDSLVKIEPEIPDFSANTGIEMASAPTSPTKANFSVRTISDATVIVLPNSATQKDRRTLADYVLSLKFRKAS